MKALDRYIVHTYYCYILFVQLNETQPCLDNTYMRDPIANGLGRAVAAAAVAWIELDHKQGRLFRVLSGMQLPVTVEQLATLPRRQLAILSKYWTT